MAQLVLQVLAGLSMTPSLRESWKQGNKSDDYDLGIIHLGQQTQFKSDLCSINKNLMATKSVQVHTCVDIQHTHF